MGKTKLLWELRKWVRENAWNDDAFQGSFCCCETVLCFPGTPREKIGEDATFSYHLDVPYEGSDDASRTLEATGAIVKQLDDILRACQKKEQEASGGQQSSAGRRRRKVILLFDESQHLLLNDGSAFRSVRWWLCRDRSNEWAADVVAVFTGTTLNLTNVYADPPEQSTTSRLPSDRHYVSGESMYGPFWNLCTIGVFANLSQNDTMTASDYKQAVTAVLCLP
jgi:hypothetical protein